MQNWAAKIAQFQNGKLLMVWCSTSGYEVDASNRLWISTSTDDGATWSEPSLFADSDAEGSVLGPCCYTHNDGHTFIFYNVIKDKKHRVAFQTTADMGKTWSQRRYIDTKAKSTGLMSDAIRLQSGEILLPIYFGHSQHYTGSVMLSGDGGETWRRGGDFSVDAPRGAMEPTIAQLTDGGLYCLMRTKTGYLYECYSHDGGHTWTRPKKSVFSSPEAMAILLKLHGTKLAFAWNNNNVSRGAPAPRYPMYVAISEDDAASWPYLKMVQTTYGAKQLSNHGLFQTKSGAILLPVNRYAGGGGKNRRGDIELARFDETWARSQLSTKKWRQKPSPTGGIRLDGDGLLLVAGAGEGDTTLLHSRFGLPRACVVEYTITDINKAAGACNGVYMGAGPFNKQKPCLCLARSDTDKSTPAIFVSGSQFPKPEIIANRDCYYDSTKVALTLNHGKIRYEDSNGDCSDWMPLPEFSGESANWGFFSRNSGSQGRVKIRDLIITTTHDSPRESIRDGSIKKAGYIEPAKNRDVVLDIGSTLEPFVDKYLIDRLDSARMVLHHPRHEGAVLKFDKPWEGIFSGYCTIIKDGDLYRAYYRGMPASGDGGAEEVTCVAESKDGKTWIKPNLVLYKINGTWENNVVYADDPPNSHNFHPFIDARPGVPQAERYKATAGLKRKLYGFVSPDGLRWRKIQPEPILTCSPFDSANVAFWSDAEQCYLCYFRVFIDGVRWVARSKSKDFLNWGPIEEIKAIHKGKAAPPEQIYTTQTHPYFRAPHIYIAPAARFMPGRQVIGDTEAKRLGVHPKYLRDISDAVLMTSRGGDVFDRTFMEGFISNEIGLNNWISRSNYPAWHIVETGPAEMSLYANCNYAQPTAELRRFSMRLDGFASIQAGYDGGRMTTRPFKFKGSRLLLNFSTSAAGGIRVEIQDACGKPILGFTLADCDEIIGNEIERAVSWKGSRDVRPLAGWPVRLLFEIKDADLYAIRFK